MADIFTSSERSNIMARIRGRNTKPEISVRKLLFSRGLRYRLHQKKLPGTPDIVFKKAKVAVFVHGCYWHQHKRCKDVSLPTTRTEYWIPKLAKNIERDKAAVRKLKKMGWKVHVIWECALKKPNKLSKQLLNIVDDVKHAQ